MYYLVYPEFRQKGKMCKTDEIFENVILSKKLIFSQYNEFILNDLNILIYLYIHCRLKKLSKI